MSEAKSSAKSSTWALPLFCPPEYLAELEPLAEDWGIEVSGIRDSLKFEMSPLVLWFDQQGLSVRQTGKKALGPVSCDFAGGAARHRRLYGGGKGQSIAKAVGVKDGLRPSIVDLTAGLGGDACVLAGLGCSVVMVERHPVVAALLADGLRRGHLWVDTDAELAALMANMSMRQESALDWLLNIRDSNNGINSDENCPDVIYLDPMFPEKRKSAQVNKNMQIFQQMVGADLDADALLPLALTRARHRVVVKRPNHAPWLNDVKPPLTMTGKSVRFDIYPLKKFR